jgi:hypothetical protein
LRVKVLVDKMDEMEKLRCLRWNSDGRKMGGGMRCFQGGERIEDLV